MDIQNTGERILLEKESALMIARHFCAYRFAQKYCLNKRVLDFGCGEGYGANYLSENAREVTAMDYDKGVVDYAKEKYKKGNLIFYAASAEEISAFSNNKFGVITCFQAIEHIPDAGRFLEDIKGLLEDGGVFICSTCNKLDASPHSDVPANKFHVREYLYDEFRSSLMAHFGAVDMYGLKRGARLNFYRRLKKIGLFNFLPASIDPVKRFYKEANCGYFVISKNRIETALDFIAVCRK